MARQSKRLRSEPPEIQDLTFTCFVCRATSDSCATNVIRMNCCNQFVHGTCATQWASSHDRCGLCRQSLRTTTAVAVQPVPVGVTPGRETMTRQQVLDRLRGLLNSDELQRQLDRVRRFLLIVALCMTFYSYFYFYYVLFGALKKICSFIFFSALKENNEYYGPFMPR